MDFSEALHERVSVRAYLDKPVPAEVLAAILDDARHCASWSNTRGYVIALAHGERLERLKAAYLQAWDDAVTLRRGKARAFVKAALRGKLPSGDFKTWKRYPPELRERQVANGKRYYGHLEIAREDHAKRDLWERKNLEFFGAPVVGFVFVHRDILPFSAQDAGIMLQNLMLSATAHGLGTVALGTLATWRHPVDAEFEIPEDYMLITGCALGYPDWDAHVNDFRAEHPAIPLAKPR